MDTTMIKEMIDMAKRLAAAETKLQQISFLLEDALEESETYKEKGVNIAPNVNYSDIKRILK